MNSSTTNFGKIIAITVLLFSLTAQLAAQTREHEETLQNLKDIDVVVKYGQVNGQEEAWQSNLLQKLEDRARQRLWEAGVPISQDEARPGRPRLVFTVNMNREIETAPPILVTAEAFQRVRLWRDSAKELELATWTMNGVGGVLVTRKMVYDVFDGQIAEFLKAYRAVNSSSSQVPTQMVAAKPAQLNDTPNTFEGLNSTAVFVGVPRDMLLDGRPPVSQKFLQEAAETRLKEAGIKVIRYANEVEAAGNARLYIWIKLTPPNMKSWGPPIGVESSFSQWVRLIRDPKSQAEAVTWKSQDSGPYAKTDSGASVITDEAVLAVVNKQLDEFIKAFKAATAPRQ
jgi:hypothetical protein